MVNVNREILNHTLTKETEREGEREKSEPNLLGRNDFSSLPTYLLKFIVGGQKQRAGKTEEARQVVA